MKTDNLALVVSMLALCASITVSIIDCTGNNTSESDTTNTSYTDAQIMESRMFVSDYDNRIKNATSMINSCVKTLSECKQIAYDAYSIPYDAYSDIKKDMRKDYTTHKKISMKPLTVEVYNVGN